MTTGLQCFVRRRSSKRRSGLGWPLLDWALRYGISSILAMRVGSPYLTFRMAGRLNCYMPFRRTTDRQAVIGLYGHGIVLRYPRLRGRVLTQTVVGIKTFNDAQLELVPPLRALLRRLRKWASISTVMWFESGRGEYVPKGFKCSEGAMAWVRDGGQLRDSERTTVLTIPLPLHEEHGGDDAGPPPSVAS